MSFEQKLAQLNSTIAAEAATLGLIFVNGPDPSAWTPPTPSTGSNNGQDRGVYLFGVAEA